MPTIVLPPLLATSFALQPPGAFHAGEGSDTMSYGDEGIRRLRYAGDLDRDGKLDLIFHTSDHHNLSRPTLFLSTREVDGAPLEEVAHHEATGC